MRVTRLGMNEDSNEDINEDDSDDDGERKKKQKQKQKPKSLKKKRDYDFTKYKHTPFLSLNFILFALLVRVTFFPLIFSLQLFF